MKVRIVNRPTGLINGREWPQVGEEIDLPQVVAEGMAAVGDVEVVQPKAKVEKPETRPSKAKAETRKKTE
jgi:hypothetical protein